MTHAGLYRAIVEDSVDPQARKRLRVSIPVAGVQSCWAEACLPSISSAGAAHGGNLPSVGTRVWVMFEGGDPAHPVWMGKAV